MSDYQARGFNFYLYKGCHAHPHSNILCMWGVGDITILLVVVIALLLLLGLILRAVGGVALLVITVVTLLLQDHHSNSVLADCLSYHFIKLHFLHLLYLINALLPS